MPISPRGFDLAATLTSFPEPQQPTYLPGRGLKMHSPDSTQGLQKSYGSIQYFHERNKERTKGGLVSPYRNFKFPFWVRLLSCCFLSRTKDNTKPFTIVGIKIAKVIGEL